MNTILLTKYIKALDKIIIGFLLVILFGFLSDEYDYFGLKINLIHLPNVFHEFFEIITYFFLTILFVDLLFKYLLVKSLKLFFTNYWFDFVTAILIPIFLPMKFINLKLYKLLKLNKSVIKFAKKISSKVKEK